ncbi:MAG: exopolysaccharide biosynthesis protein [Woeseia sp.]
MNANHEVTDLEQLLHRIRETTGNGDTVSLGQIFDVVGHRSFGPLLLVAGLVTLAPIIGDIPGVPTIMAILVLLIALQVLFHHDHLWLPHWLLNRSVAEDKLCKALNWMQRPARFIDRFLRPRLTMLTNRRGAYAVAAACAVVAVLMPATEVVPFSANGVGLVLTAFGLALISHDGLLAVFAFVVLAATAGIALYYLL